MIININRQPDCILPKSFFEGRFIPDVHPDSTDYQQWWDEQIRRCLFGYKDGGFYVPNNYYYHLNFKKINLLAEDGKPKLDFPLFSQEDLDLFLEIEDARQWQKGMMLITGRGFGKSFDAASVAEHEFTFYPASEVIVSASTLPFVDGLYGKIKLGLNSQPDEFRHLLLKNTESYMESGVEVTVNGKKKIEGYRSKIWKVAYDDKPGKTRGTRPNIHLWEEVGSWTGAASLIDCYNKTEASWWRGSVFTCFPFLIGTGGEMTTGGSADAREMFYNPESFNLKSYSYKGAKMGKFIPAFKKFGGFYEKDGLNHEKQAKEWLEKRRKSKEDNPTVYMQEIQEFPFEPDEAFLSKDGGWFPAALIQNRIADITKDPRKQIVQKGRLEWLKAGGRIVGIEWIDDVNGPFEKIEDPYIREGKYSPPEYLYVSGCDSFDALLEKEDPNKDTSKSKGSIVVYKRFLNANQTSHIFVAKLTQRTSDDVEFYQNTYKLNYYYNAQMLFEYTKIGIGRWYVTNKLSKYLMQRPQLEKEGIIKKTTSTNTYGVAMPEKVKVHAIKNYASYMKGALSEESGQVVDTKINDMYFLSQLKDALEFTFGSSKYDETMASAIALLAENELYNVEVEEAVENAYKFPTFKTNKYGRTYFG